ncbi:hypothetical protein [Thermoanaerobacterium sp. DL9XJH110]|uniref:DUF7916 family protein n=1 Tax=Thermoanaerobacterium sp. DL9XJH110 TaxID=3386643 RepID=UPI003BB71BDF
MKRIFELGYNEILSIKKPELLEIIKNSEGRTVMAEAVIAVPPLIYGVSDLELAAAFGADMVTMNMFDFNAPFIFGVDDKDLDLTVGPGALDEIKRRMEKNREDADYIKGVKKMVGRFLGVNLEPVPDGVKYPEGRQLNEANLKKARAQGFDYIVITGNPKTGVTAGTVLEGIETAARILGDTTVIIAGKMHGAGGENIYKPDILKDFVKAGADAVLIPAPGTVPGIDLELAKRQIDVIHEAGALALTAIGTSQEGAGERVIEQLALMSKMAGADIQHIGDAGYAGIAFPENIMALSIAVRGKRHTYRRMAYSMRK